MDAAYDGLPGDYGKERDAARDYVNGPRGARFEGNRLVVSRLCEWSAVDFGGGEVGVLAHLRSYAVPALRSRLETTWRVDGYPYDWSLNDTSRP